MLYSYKNQEPSDLPFRIRLDDGSTRTSLNKLSDNELKSLGFIGPITKPEFDDTIQKIVWNGNEYEIIELNEKEIEEKKSEDRIKNIQNINYNFFWQKLIESNFYRKLRSAASQSLGANTLCTELMIIFSEAKTKKANIGMIQEYINILFFNFQFSDEEIQELKSIMEETDLSSIYSLPDSEYLSSHYYDQNLNKIIGPSPFNSWILIDGRWEAPVPYPTDGKIYSWNEEKRQWVE